MSDVGTAFARAQIELTIVDAILADDSLPIEAATGAVLRAWDLVRAAAGVESMSDVLKSCLGAAAAESIRADLDALRASPYGRFRRDTLKRHAESIGRCLRRLAPEEPEFSRWTWDWIGRRRRALSVLAATCACAIGAWLLLRPKASWRAMYFTNIDLAGEPDVQFDSAILFTWTGRRPRYDIWPSNYSVRWDTCLALDAPTMVEFRLGSDDGSRLYVDGAVVIDAWSDHPFIVATDQRLLSPGKHAMRVEYYQKGGEARVSLEMSAPSAPARRLDRLLSRPPQPFDPSAPCG